MHVSELYREACRDGNMGVNADRLRSLAAQCSHITEFGTRNGHSAACSLITNPKKFITYDIAEAYGVPEMLKGMGAVVRIQNVWMKDFVIEPTDMLFTDTEHDYRYLRHELFKHSPFVKRFIAIHDTEAAGMFFNGQNGGLKYAIEEFLWEGTFKQLAHYPEDRGMTVLERINGTL